MMTGFVPLYQRHLSSGYAKGEEVGLRMYTFIRNVGEMNSGKINEMANDETDLRDPLQ